MKADETIQVIIHAYESACEIFFKVCIFLLWWTIADTPYVLSLVKPISLQQFVVAEQP